MEKKNLTISLPKELLRKAKIHAASIDKSINQIIREALERVLNADQQYEAARRRQLKLLEQGFNLGTKGKLSFSRDELHER